MKQKFTAQEKKEIVHSFKKWHYEFDLGDGIMTKCTRKNHMKWHNLRRNFFMGAIDELFNGSLKGKTFLDIACNAGFWSFELAKRNASYGLAIDISSEHIRQAKFVKHCIQKDNEYDNLEFKNIDFFDLPITNQKFDLIMALGIVYHLTDPVGFFKRVSQLSNYSVFIDTTISTINTDEPILEIGNSDKYVSIGKREFSFIPNEKALLRILNHSGFKKILKLSPPPSKDETAYQAGRRLALFASKD